jgi:hypothetical protein
MQDLSNNVVLNSIPDNLTTGMQSVYEILIITITISITGICITRFGH